MNRVTWLLAIAILTVPSGAWASAFLLAPSGESLTLECRSGGLYLGYQLDGLPSCHESECSAIRVRSDRGEWTRYAAHNGSNLGFVRNKHSTVRKNGDTAETLLARMLEASSVDFLNPGTGKPVTFSIGEADKATLESVAAKCGATGS